MNRKVKKIAAFLATLVIAFNSGSIPSSAVETPESGNADYIAFTSDTHCNDSGEAEKRLDEWLNHISETNGNITLDYIGVCGDMAAAHVTQDVYWEKTQDVVDVVKNNIHVKKGIFTTGNHEYRTGYFDNISEEELKAEPYCAITRIGEAANEENYQIYCLGAYCSEGNSLSFLDEDIQALDEYLGSVDAGKPVFIMSHFPLHSYDGRSILNAEDVIEVLNNYPNAIFLWGHNHTLFDPHYEKVYTQYLDETPINFIYCTAGCMSDSEHSEGSASIAAKGFVAEFDGDDDFELTYYDKNFEKYKTYIINTKEGTAEEKSIIHQRSKEWKYNDTYHWHECTCGGMAEKQVHQFGNWKVTKAATCTEEGIEVRACSCGKTETRNISKLSHNYSKEWKYDETNHWHECTCGEKQDLSVHQYGEWKVIKAATCTEEGIEVRACSCGKTETQVIPALEHVYDSAWKYDETNHWHECICGEMIDSSVHNFGEWKVTKSATYKAAGVKKRKCECGFTETASTKKLTPKTQKITVKKSSYTYKVSKFKKKSVTISLKASAKGKLSYKVTKGTSKNITVTSKGKVKLKKGCKAGTYKVRITAAETKNGMYKKATKVVTIKVKK